MYRTNRIGPKTEPCGTPQTSGGGGGWHCLVRMELRQAGWPVYLPLLIFPCTIKSRSSLLAPAHPGGSGKRAEKWLWWCGGMCLGIFGLF